MFMLDSFVIFYLYSDVILFYFFAKLETEDLCVCVCVILSFYYSWQ